MEPVAQYLLAVLLSIVTGLGVYQLPDQFKVPFLISCGVLGVCLYFVPPKSTPPVKPA